MDKQPAHLTNNMNTTKPLIVIPPAPSRWQTLQELPLPTETLSLADLRIRLEQGVPGAQDALAIVPDGGHVLSCAWISKRHDLGILSRVVTRPEHRRRGLARQLIEALLSWFDMTGGKWLYATTTVDLAEGLFARFGFKLLRCAPRDGSDAAVIVRVAADLPTDPLFSAGGELTIHDITRANWPSLVVLLYNRSGPDSRVSLDESAVTAELTALDLISRFEAGTCHLKAAFHGSRLIGLASVATEPMGDRTYAMITPYADTPAALREAAIEFAQSKGYQKVDFPMEALAAT
jgi:GNAT superfamily N-acetyltransferase